MVERNDAQNPFGHIIEYCEESVDHPVSQPLGIIIMIITFNGLKGSVGWVKEADSRNDKATSKTEGHEQNYDSHRGRDQNSRLDSYLLGSFLNETNLSEFFSNFVKFLLDSLHLYLYALLTFYGYLNLYMIYITIRD